MICIALSSTSLYLSNIENAKENGNLNHQCLSYKNLGLNPSKVEQSCCWYPRNWSHVVGVSVLLGARQAEGKSGTLLWESQLYHHFPIFACS